MDGDLASSGLVNPAGQSARLGLLVRFADLVLQTWTAPVASLRSWLAHSPPAAARQDAGRDRRVAEAEMRHASVHAPAAETPGDVLASREFMIDIAHELRTPVATIRASAEVLADMLAAGSLDHAPRIVENLEREAGRLALLVDNLLDLNTIRAGQTRLRPATCDLREVAHNAVSAIAPLADRRGQTIDVVLPPEPVWAVVDRELIERALLNLLSNAQKFGLEGGHLGVTLQARARQAVVSVEDDGPGIAEGDRERIFERLYRAETSAARRVQGSGLGLPIARAAVELHGGRIAVAAAPRGGSVFSMCVPLESVSLRPQGAASEDPPDRR